MSTFNMDGVEENTDQLEPLTQALVDGNAAVVAAGEQTAANTAALEAGIDAIVTQTDTLEANTDTLEALINATNALVTSTNSLITSTNTKLDSNIAQVTELNNKTPDIRTDFMAGRVRTAGGMITIGANGFGCFRIYNPSGSAKVITVSSFNLATSIASTCKFWFDSTISSGITTVTPMNPNRAFEGTGQVTSAVVQQAAAARTGGTQISPVLLVPANDPVEFQFPLVLVPGQSIVAQVQSTSLAAMEFYCNGTWAEDPA